MPVRSGVREVKRVLIWSKREVVSFFIEGERAVFRVRML